MRIYQVDCLEDEDYTVVFAKQEDAEQYSKTLGEDNSQILPITLTGTKVEIASQLFNRLDCVKQNSKSLEEATQTIKKWESRSNV